MTAYYNEHDPAAAAWLRELIAGQHLAPGYVDERSIEDVRPSDLDGFTQCHFFAGIGGWSLALRLAGWSDNRPVWTGSCPCQSFSAAGKGAGFADERHLWPAWFHLIEKRRPSVVFGEQVEAAVRHGWLDLVRADMEGADYFVGAAVLGAHSVGSPHIRQRLWFVANSDVGTGQPGQPRANERAISQADGGVVADSIGTGLEERPGERGNDGAEQQATERGGMWTNCEWVECIDGKSRPVKSSFLRMVDGVSSRMVQCGDNIVSHIEAKEKEVTNAEEATTESREALPALQREDGEEAIPGINRGYDTLQEKEILQSRVHGESIRRGNENENPEKLLQAIEKGSKGDLRGVWKSTHTACPSCGRESFEQLKIEFDDVMRQMPQRGAFSEFLGADGSSYMQALQQTGDESWSLLDSQYPLSEVWESLDDEEKNRVRVHFNNRAWVMTEGTWPLVDGLPRGVVRGGDSFDANATGEARKTRIKGYGNAIVPQVAAQFIAAYMSGCELEYSV